MYRSGAQLIDTVSWQESLIRNVKKKRRKKPELKARSSEPRSEVHFVRPHGSLKCQNKMPSCCEETSKWDVKVTVSFCSSKGLRNMKRTCGDYLPETNVWHEEPRGDFAFPSHIVLQLIWNNIIYSIYICILWEDKVERRPWDLISKSFFLFDKEANSIYFASSISPNLKFKQSICKAVS